MIIQWSVKAANSYIGDIEDGHKITPEDVTEMGFVVEGENMTIRKALVAAEEYFENYEALKIIAIECLNMYDD